MLDINRTHLIESEKALLKRAQHAKKTAQGQHPEPHTRYQTYHSPNLLPFEDDYQDDTL